MQVVVTGINAAQEKIAGIEPSIKKSLAQAVDELFSTVKQRIGKHSKSGALERSLQSVRRSPTSYRLLAGGQNAIWAKFVHDGTRPHVILPNKKKVLRWAGGGVFFFAKKVSHPGNKPDRWFDDAAAQAPLLFQSFLSKNLKGQ
jgi:hypothetical protein